MRKVTRPQWQLPVKGVSLGAKGQSFRRSKGLGLVPWLRSTSVVDMVVVGFGWVIKFREVLGSSIENLKSSLCLEIGDGSCSSR